ncbi:MAG: hypothetical protein WCS51_02470 [Bacilli bacterium]
MKKKNKKSKGLIAVLVFSFLGVVGFGTYVVSNYVSDNFTDSVIKNNKALWIGCPLTVPDSLGVEYPVSLNVRISNSSSSYSNSWETSSNEFIQDENYSNIGFIDLTSVFSNYSDKQDVDVFCNASDSNYVYVQTVWLGPIEISSKTKFINDSGLWFFNVAAENDGDIESSHSFIYVNYVYDWNLFKEDN